jgi:hypothetical protein
MRYARAHGQILPLKKAGPHRDDAVQPKRLRLVGA